MPDEDNYDQVPPETDQVPPVTVQDQSIPTDINALIVKLPAFWANSPRTWFIQAEAQFTLGKITAARSKYNYVVATLPEEISDSVADILFWQCDAI